MKKIYVCPILLILLNACISSINAATYTVTSNASGTTTDGVSLRWAMTQANSNPGADTIAFNISGTPPQMITLAAQLPALSGVNGAGTVIDGTTQPNNGFTGVSPKIIINGNGGFNYGLSLQAASCEVYGLMITNFPGNATGIDVSNGGSNFIIGAPGKGNVINKVAMGGTGINISSGINTGKIQGNKIGSDTTGTISQSTYTGISITDISATNPARNILIGGSGAGEGNLVSGQTGANSCNIYVRSCNLIFIKGNIIGPSINGVTKLSPGTNINTNDGIYLYDGADSCVIGGSLPGEGNIISYNEDTTNHIGGGIEIEAAHYNLISRNSIFCNGTWLGIQLINGNDSYSSPVISTANNSGASGTAPVNAIVELFYNHTGCTHTPHGCSGETYIATVNADNGGTWSYSGALLGGSLTATATDPLTNNTSAFSNCSAIVATLPPVTGFQSSETTFCANDCINYTDKSTNATSWQWSFPGGMPASSTNKNPQSICYAGNGAYNVTLIASNSAGSDTLMLTNFITVLTAPPPPVITQSTEGDTLFCSFDSTYSAYKWYSDTALIQGATNAFYVVSNTGNYNVQVTNKNGCSIASGINVILTGVQSPFSISGLKLIVSPDPVLNDLVINFKQVPIQSGENWNLSVLNLLGEKILSYPLILGEGSAEAINVQTLSSGVYFLQLANESNSWVGKFVKQ